MAVEFQQLGGFGFVELAAEASFALLDRGCETRADLGGDVFSPLAREQASEL
jgi:hypothetical protein